MTIYSYFPKADHAAAEKKQYVKTYLDTQQLHADVTIEEQSDLKIHWEKRDIGHFLMDTAKQGDILITYDTLDIARSTCQMLELLMAATSKGISIHFVKYDMVFQGKPTNQLHDLLALMQQVESDYCHATFYLVHPCDKQIGPLRVNFFSSFVIISFADFGCKFLTI